MEYINKLMHLNTKMLRYILYLVLLQTVSSNLLRETSTSRNLKRVEDDVFAIRKALNEESDLRRQDISTIFTKLFNLQRDLDEERELRRGDISDRLTESSRKDVRHDKEPVAIVQHGTCDCDAIVSQYKNVMKALKSEKSVNIMLQMKFDETRKEHDLEIGNLREMFKNVDSRLDRADRKLSLEIETIKNKTMDSAFNREKSANIMLSKKVDEIRKDNDFEIGNIREKFKNVDSRLDRADRTLRSEIDTIKKETKEIFSAAQKLVHDSYVACQQEINHTRAYFNAGLIRVNESSTNRSLNALHEIYGITSGVASLNTSKQIVNKVTDQLHHPRSCDGVEKSGEYKLYPSSHPNGIMVYCSKDSTNKGWIVIQRRADGSVNFNRTWADYKAGFGNMSGDFWLGNEHIYQLTRNERRELRIDMEMFNGTKRYAVYSKFSISSETEKYELHVSGYSGDAGDEFTTPTVTSYTHNNQSFSTYDADNDKDYGCCACFYGDGWWHHSCFSTNLNGKYIQRSDQVLHRHGIRWYTLPSKHETSSRRLYFVVLRSRRRRQINNVFSTSF